MPAPVGTPGNWSWGYNAKRSQVAFRALEDGETVIFVEGPVVKTPEDLRAWVHGLIAHLRDNDLVATGFPEEALLESARETFEKVHGLTWGHGS